jgi:hypothetical protein
MHQALVGFSQMLGAGSDGGFVGDDTACITLRL